MDIKSNVKAILIFIVLVFLSMTLGQKFTNAAFSIIITLMAIASFYFCYILWISPLKSPSKAFRSPVSFFLITVFMVVMSVGFGFVSYLLFRYEPLEIMCRYSNTCEVGPYGWSVALLLLGCSLMCFIINYLGMKIRLGG